MISINKKYIGGLHHPWMARKLSLMGADCHWCISVYGFYWYMGRIKTCNCSTVFWIDKLKLPTRLMFTWLQPFWPIANGVSILYLLSFWDSWWYALCLRAHIASWKTRKHHLQSTASLLYFGFRGDCYRLQTDLLLFSLPEIMIRND